MKYITLLYFSFLFFGVFAQSTPMTPNEIKLFKVTVNQKTEHITSIQTDFKQQKHLSFLANDITSSGKMFLTQDGKLKWAYIKPNKYSIIFTKNQIIINDNGEKSIVKGNQKMFQKLSHVIAGSVSGKLFDDNEFKISYFKSNTTYRVKLLPKDKVLMSYIKAVNLYFKKGNGTVQKVKLVEPSGDYTLIQFLNKKLNEPISPSIFTH